MWNIVCEIRDHFHKGKNSLNNFQNKLSSFQINLNTWDKWVANNWKIIEYTNFSCEPSVISC